MPELPEVEVVRLGLARWVTGRAVSNVRVLHSRAVRRHVAGPADFCARLSGRTVTGVLRRGKYMWLPLDSGAAMLLHLGMSGQVLLQPTESPAERHLRVLVRFDNDGTEMRFVDQRTFGYVLVDSLVDDGVGGYVPSAIRHIARDPLDPQFDEDAFVTALSRRRTELKRALLDQSLLSGVGNIYADEALWRARMHGRESTTTLSRTSVVMLLEEVRSVMRAALAEGGTSFDALYVDVNGDSGYFERGLNVYGRESLPCERCGTPIQREAFMNRSSYSCPTCQAVRV